MFTKLGAFRSKAAAAQKVKKYDHESVRSQNHFTEEDNSNKDAFKFSLKSMLASVPDALFHESTLLNSDSPNTTSHRNLSSESIKPFSPNCYRESPNVPSGQSKDVIIGPPLFLSYEDAEEQFLEDHESYFLHLLVDNVRMEQYPVLEMRKIIYLDHATCPLYSHFQVEQHMKFLLEETETVGWSYTIDQKTAAKSTYIDLTYQHILKYLNTSQEDYSIVFTPGLASCYRLFTDMLQLQKGSLVLISPDHHIPVQHVIKESVRSHVKIGTIPLKDRDLTIQGTEMHRTLRKQGWNGQGSGLLIYSAQSFSTGMCHSMSWITGAQQNGWKVLLDVSSSLPMVNVDLSTYKPEFVIGSLHHMLGYPSDLSFLLVRRCSHTICTKKGSRELQLIEHRENGKVIHVVAEGENFTTHTVAAISFGFEHLENIGMMAIQRRVESLISWLIKALKSLKHKVSEKPLIQLYGSLDVKDRGSILAFNLLDPTGNIFPARAVQQLAERNKIILGYCDLIDAKISNLLHQKSHRPMDSIYAEASLSNLHVLRLSLGAVSAFSDAYSLVQFLSRFRDEKYMSSIAAGYAEEIENEC